MTIKSLKLVIPGPIQPDDDVLEAMGAPVQPHYGKIFTEFYSETLQCLRPVFNTQGSLFLMPGSGSVGIDACLGSAFSSGEKILLGSNGFFGERMVGLAESYGLRVVVVKAEYGHPLDPADFEAAFEAHPDAAGVALVHLETSTAVVNPVAEIAAVSRKAGKYCFVDAVSSIGGLPFDMDNWGVDLVATASQKCLGAPPGVAPVAVGKRGWEAIDRNPNKCHGWYGNLTVWRWYAENWGDWHPFPITMNTNNVAALRVALDHLLEEGIANRLERYCGLALRLREGLRRVGMPPFTPDAMLAPVLTAAYVPEGVDSHKIVDYMADVHGIKISTGLGTLKSKLIRVGHMSPTVTEADIDEVIEALGAFPG